MKPSSRHLVMLSLCYWILRRLLELVVLALSSEEAKEVEIIVLRHQLHVLNRQVKRPHLQSHARALLAAASRVLPRGRWASVFVRLETILALAPSARGAALDLPATNGPTTKANG